VNLIKQPFGRGDAHDGATDTPETCVHEALGTDAHEPGRVGDEDAITDELCETCGSTMSPERARMLQQERVTRLRRTGF
jgi:hypothetical protein